MLNMDDMHWYTFQTNREDDGICENSIVGHVNKLRKLEINNYDYAAV